jgi:hypothetical protein
MHETGLRLDEVIESGVVFFAAKISEAWDWAINKIGVVAWECLVVYFQFFSDSWDEIFDDCIWGFH